MDYRAFKAMIERQAHVPPDVADRALRTTPATLAGRLTKGERRDLADQLPLEVAPWILPAEGEAAAGVDAFLQDLAGALREVLGEEFFDVTVELPREYGAILPAPLIRAP